MTAFVDQVNSGITLWTGDPDCQAAHDELLNVLTGRATFIGPAEELGKNRQGNLGEFTTFRVGFNTPSLANCERFARNAMMPLNSSSIPGLDITYILFHDSDPANDLIYIQEVKTTFDSDLSYGDTLIADYEKLFGTNLNLTLFSRLQAAANSLEFEHRKPHLCARAIQLAATIPSACTQVRLMPTIVHEKNNSDPVTKLIAIRQAIVSKGWDRPRVLTGPRPISRALPWRMYRNPHDFTPAGETRR